MKTLSFALLFIILFISSNGALAYNTSYVVKNDTLLKKYNDRTIYTKGKSNKFIYQSDERRIGFLGKRLAKFFGNISPDASDELEIYANQTKTGIFLTFLGLITFFITLYVFAISLIVGTTFLFFLVFSLLIYMWGLLKYTQAPEYLQRAIWYYNRDVIMK